MKRKGVNEGSNVKKGVTLLYSVTQTYNKVSRSAITPCTRVGIQSRLTFSGLLETRHTLLHMFQSVHKGPDVVNW